MNQNAGASSCAHEELSFTYFPESYRGSHGLLIGLNAAPWGGADFRRLLFRLRGFPNPRTLFNSPPDPSRL